MGLKDSNNIVKDFKVIRTIINIKTFFLDTPNALVDAKKVYSKLKKTNDVVHCVVPNTISYSGGLGKNKIHPTQKPEEILEYFITLCSNPDDTVLDTFAGSGSTGAAARSIGRNAILIERDPEMYKKMSARFDDSNLFD